MTTLLITRPRYEETTFYLFSWTKTITDEAKRLGLKIIDLAEERAKKNELMSVMKKTDPELLIFNGHGGEDFICGQDDETLIKVGDNEAILKNKIIFSLSCQSAKKLGHASIKIGAKAYIGYIEDFIFWTKKGYETRPLQDPWARLFFEPTNALGIALLKGNSAGNAHEKARKKFLENIQELISTNSQDLFLTRSLLLNYAHQVCLGNQSASI